MGGGGCVERKVVDIRGPQATSPEPLRARRDRVSAHLAGGDLPALQGAELSGQPHDRVRRTHMPCVERLPTTRTSFVVNDAKFEVLRRGLNDDVVPSLGERRCARPEKFRRRLPFTLLFAVLTGQRVCESVHVELAYRTRSEQRSSDPNKSVQSQRRKPTATAMAVNAGPRPAETPVRALRFAIERTEFVSTLGTAEARPLSLVE